MSLTKYAKPEELKIVNALIDAFLAQGYTLGVHDGEQRTVKESKEADIIREALCTTDEDYLVVLLNGTWFGQVRLIWGNGCDVVSDWSVDVEPLVEEVLTAQEVL